MKPTKLWTDEEVDAKLTENMVIKQKLLKKPS